MPLVAGFGFTSICIPSESYNQQLLVTSCSLGMKREFNSLTSFLLIVAVNLIHRGEALVPIGRVGSSPTSRVRDCGGIGRRAG